MPLHSTNAGMNFKQNNCAGKYVWYGMVYKSNK